MSETQFVRVDVNQLRAFAASLKKISPALLPGLYAGLVEAGEVVASAAKTIVAAGRGTTKGSTRIPSTIKVRRRGVIVKVQAGGKDAPHAAPLNNRGYGGQFRHP